jgi:hypothetical protein
MKNVCIIAGVLTALAEAATAQLTIPLPVMPVRKAAIQNVWVEPAQLTSSTPVACRVTVADDVRLDKAENRRLGSAFILKLYWVDPPVGATATTAEYTETLGTLPSGLYTLLVQSLYNGRLVDTKQVVFRVSEAPVSAPSYIDRVWIEPENPTTEDPVTLHVSGKWGTPGFSLTGLATMLAGDQIMVRMYWRSPAGSVPQVVTPYEREIGFPALYEDAYRATVYCYRDNRLVDSAQITFDVAPAAQPGIE